MLEIRNIQLKTLGENEFRKFVLKKVESIPYDYPFWAGNRSNEIIKELLNEIIAFADEISIFNIESLNEFIDLQIKFDLIKLSRLNIELNKIFSDEKLKDAEKIRSIRYFLIKNKIEMR